MSTTTEPIVTEQIAAPTPQVVEAPTPVTEQESTKTEEVKAEEAKVEEPAATTTDEVAATAVTEAPHPTTSKSNPTNRLSLFLGKAKTYVDKKVHEKKPAVPKKDTATEEATETVAEPVVASPTTEEAPAVATEEPATREVETTKAPKAEKRKSILAGIFRSKSPVNKEVEKSEDVTAAATVEEVAKPDETVTDKEIQETPAAVAAASATGVVEEESVVVEHAEKENVMDQIKRSPLGKLFKQKKEVEHKEEPVPATTPETEAPIIAEPDVVAEETPAVDVAEPAVEAPVAAQEKVARSGSPLGRRITQMFRGFSSKKKVPTVATTGTEEPAKEENTREIVTETAAIEDVPAAAPTAAKEEVEQQEKPASEAVTPAQVPAAQPST